MTDDPDRPPIRGLRFIGVGLSFGAYVAVGGYLGHWADERWGVGSLATPIGILLGAAFGTWDLLRMTAAIERDEKDGRKPK